MRLDTVMSHSTLVYPTAGVRTHDASVLVVELDVVLEAFKLAGLPGFRVGAFVDFEEPSAAGEPFTVVCEFVGNDLGDCAGDRGHGRGREEGASEESHLAVEKGRRSLKIEVSRCKPGELKALASRELTSFLYLSNVISKEFILRSLPRSRRK